jgi:two-component system, NtrC family, response regulator PilR
LLASPTAFTLLNILLAMPHQVLIIDDEADIRELLVLTLTRMGIEVDSAGSVAEAERFLSRREYGLVLTDMRLSDGTGMDILDSIGRTHGNTPVAVITAHGSTDNAVAALKAGAFDYVAKPIKLQPLRDMVTNALKLPRAGGITQPLPVLKRGGENGQPASRFQLLGDAAPIARARELIGRVARNQAPVFISGESGTGKEVAARLIHASSPRGEKPFVAVNCGAIPENLMESEFFGYRKGAFTGADADRDGFFQAAQGGTLFLDEVGDLPLTMQVKLLRVIQDKRVRRVGDTSEIAVDVRILSATHKNLAKHVAEGEFRQDLFYRLNVIDLKMPALREIPEDIPTIVNAVAARVAGAMGIPPPQFEPAAMRALGFYDFPGNVRELENIVERAIALCNEGIVMEADLYLHREVATPSAASFEPGALALPKLGSMPLHEYLDQVERELINKALEATRYNRTQAAKLLGVTFRSLRYRLDRLGIE